MEQTGTHKANTMTTNEKWVMASTAAGFSLENMDIMFKSAGISTFSGVRCPNSVPAKLKRPCS